MWVSIIIQMNSTKNLNLVKVRLIPQSDRFVHKINTFYRSFYCLVIVSLFFGLHITTI